MKGVYETDNEVVVVPYLGYDVESPWWRTYPNAWRLPGDLFYVYARMLNPKKPRQSYKWRDGLARLISNGTTNRVWLRHLSKILREEKDFDAVVFFNVPLNQISGIPTELKNEFGVKTAFYDGDMPTILPENASDRGFMFDYYKGAAPEEFDVFFVNSEGVIKDLEERGARNVTPLHYGADPQLFNPVPAEKKWDVAFFGYGSQTREKWMTKMITHPSSLMPNTFVVGGLGFDVPLGKAELIGDVPMSGFRRFCCSAKLNLNITRESHTSVYASSTARPFELAAMGCCIVSCPYSGLEKWFDPDKEIIILSREDDPVRTYSELLADEERMRKIGEAAHGRVVKDHTYSKRAIQLCNRLEGNVKE